MFSELFSSNIDIQYIGQRNVKYMLENLAWKFFSLYMIQDGPIQVFQKKYKYKNPTLIALCKAKRQYLFTCKVSRYCLLALHGSIALQVRHFNLQNAKLKNLNLYLLEVVSCYRDTQL